MIYNSMRIHNKNYSNTPKDDKKLQEKKNLKHER